LSGAKFLRKEIIAKAKDEAHDLLKESNRMIENTIRQIRESQAEKEKTKEIRHELDEFRSNVSVKPDNVELPDERKMSVLAEKARRFKSDRKPEKTQVSDGRDKPLKAGDAVRIRDTQAAGEIVSVRDDIVQVESGSVRLSLSADKVERISRSELRESIRVTQKSMAPDPVISQRKLDFKPEIDIRGVRGDEALIRVRELIDDALMVQQRNLRILHGKGNGILRQLVRDYLGTLNIVKSFRDEHVDMGGSGITVVEMDF